MVAAHTEEKWDFYPCLIEDAPASVFVDFGFEGRAPVPRADTLYRVRIGIRDGGDHGMGSAAEAEQLFPIEDQIIERAKASGLMYVGRLRTRLRWQLAFYGPGDRLDALRAVAVSLVLPGGRPVEVVATLDAAWDYYLSYVLPDPERRQWIQDRQLVNVLAEAGDPLSIPRRVDHWIYFPSSRGRNAFAVDVGQRGFEIEQRIEDPGEPLAYGVQVHRVDRVELEHIHEVVMTLIALAEPHKGDYDGWETSVEKPSWS